MSLEVPTISTQGKGKGRRNLMIGIPLAIVVIVVILYFASPKFKKWFQKTLHIKAGVPSVAQAPNVTFDIQGLNEKGEIRPNSPLKLVGQFTDESGSPVAVAQGLYYVYRTDANTGNKVVHSQGILGQNVSDFNVQVTTTNWPDGKYAIDVSDYPLETVEQGTPKLQYNPLMAATQNIAPAIG